MIVKEKIGQVPTDKSGKSGFEAEMQMAFYLRRAFAEAKDVFVFNDLKFERNGEIAQIDHLVLHRYGFVLIESKSVYGTIEVNRQLEFVRVYGKARYAMQSPIQQVKLQLDLFSRLLNDNKTSLRRRVIFGLKQASFSEDRFKTLVAVSDSGEIKRIKCDPVDLVKADKVADCIREFVARHDLANSFSGTVRSLIGDKQEVKQLDKDQLAPFTDEEIQKIVEFLMANSLSTNTHLRSTPHGLAYPSVASKVAEAPADINMLKEIENHTSEPALDSTVPTNSSKATCHHCSSQDLNIVYGKYGYYFKCLSCQGNSKIAAHCQSCSAKVRLRKQGLQFFAVCDVCQKERLFHCNSSETSKSATPTE